MRAIEHISRLSKVSVKFHPLKLEGAFLVVPEPVSDERGFFARSWCRDQFQQRGLNGDLVQCNIAFNRRLGTLRGMHFQSSPHEESKLVRCTRGAVFDVIVDARPQSSTYGQWESVRLTAAKHSMLYIPPNVAHGYQTLSNDTEVFYQVSTAYSPDSVHSFRWDDPDLGIDWPMEPTCLSARDESHGDFHRLKVGSP